MVSLLDWIKRKCPGGGQQAQGGNIQMHDEGYSGSCPGCGKVQPCDMYSMMLPHRK